MRNTKRGSWFIQELNTALRLHAKDTHLADILVQVNKQILHSQSKMCFLYSSISLTSLSSSFFPVCRSTDVLRSARVTLPEPPTIAAKRCQSSPAHCAKTSSFSPSTSPSIDMQTCTDKHTHRPFLILKPLNNNYCNTLLHSPDTTSHLNRIYSFIFSV